MPDPQTFPPTIIVVHPKEKRSKCTVEPLRGREGFHFWKYQRPSENDLTGYVRLGLGETELSADDKYCGLVVLDGTWRYAEKMQADFADLPVRSLPPWETAYPRVTKLFNDPAAGLSTIEAIFAAYYLLGRDTSGLLDDYHWRDEFLARNEAMLSSAAKT